MTDRSDWLRDAFKSFGSNTALTKGENQTSYDSLTKKIDDYISQLSPAVAQGTVVAIVSDYSADAIAAFLALHQLKAIIVPIIETTDNEIASKIQQSRCEVIVKFSADHDIEVSCLDTNYDERRPLVEALIERGETGLILFSSGTTGTPKAMLHSLNALLEKQKNKRPKNMAMLVFLMFDHIGGLNTLLNGLVIGANLVIPETREPKTIAQLIEKYQIRALPASPTFLNMMLINAVHEDYDLSSLRLITYGTEAMSESLLARLRKAFPKTKLLQTFGTSETGIAQTSSFSSDSTFMKINDPDYQHKVVDGELWLRSKTQISGYLNQRSESFSEDGWFKTGDLVEVAENGYLRIIGRKIEMINIGGEKVLPGEVETALMQMDEVLDCTVFAVPNQIMGQAVAANVVMKSEMTNREAKKIIRQYCSDKIAAYKLPTVVKVVTDVNISARMKKIRRLEDDH